MIAVARRGQQRSSAKVLQVLSVAMARSPRARIFACARLTAFRRSDSFGQKRRRLNGVRTLPRAPRYPLSAKVITAALVSASMMPWVQAAVRSRAEPGNAVEARTRRPNTRSRAIASWAYRQAVVTPISKPAASRVWVSPPADEQRLAAGVQPAASRSALLAIAADAVGEVRLDKVIVAG